MTRKSDRKVVFLDQKCWIDITKRYFAESPVQESEIVKRILTASQEGSAIFPITISHLEETMHISDDERRNRLAYIVAKISKGYGFQPYIDRNIRNEIQNVILRRLGLPELNIRSLVLKQGIPHILGARAVIESRKGAKTELPKEFQERLLDLLSTPETLEAALKWSMPRSLTAGKAEIVAKMEKNRRELSKIKDNDQRKRMFLAWNIIQIIVPELAKLLYEAHLPKDFIVKEKSSRRDIERFLDSIPSALCLFTLIFQRDQQMQRRIEENDINDIWFLTLAIPYSDIVITEKMWASLVRQTHLDRKCNTLVLSSVDELEKYL